MDVKKQEKAVQMIADIRKHQQNSTERVSDLTSQVKDLKHALRLMQENSLVSETTVLSGGESKLNRYVSKSGSIQWKTEQKNLQTPEGVVKVDQYGILDDPNPSCSWQKELQKIASDRSLVRMFMLDPHTPQLDTKLFHHLKKAPKNIVPSIQKVFNDTSGNGAEWIPDEFQPDLYKTFQVERTLASNLAKVQVNRNTVLVPRMDRGGRPYKKGMLTSDDQKYTTSTVSTAQASLSITGMACRYLIDDAAAEDSGIALLPTLQRQIAMDLQDAFEDCMINGDTAGTHQDTISAWNIRSRWGASGLGGTSDHRRCFLGLRAASYDKSTTDDHGAALTYDDFLANVYKMAELGVQDVMCVVSPEVLIKYLLPMDEIATLDKVGPQATVLTGQVAQIAGIPIIVSRFIGNDMQNTGLFTGGGGGLSGMILFNKSSWNIYERKGILLESDKNIGQGAIELVATYRGIMASADAAATKNVSYGFNL